MKLYGSMILIFVKKSIMKFEKEKKKIEGKKLYVGDEKIMSEAQRLLHEEFALVLNIKVDEVLPFILGELEPTEKEDINL